MRTYDPTEVTLSFKNYTIDGFGPGTFIKVSRNQEGWSLQKGNSGTGARSRNPDRSGKVEITLLWASPSNAVLSTFAKQDETAGTGVGAVQVKDRGTLLAKCAGEAAWIMKIPDFDRAKEVGEVTWTIEVDDLDIAHDGLIDA